MYRKPQQAEGAPCDRCKADTGDRETNGAGGRVWGVRLCYPCIAEWQRAAKGDDGDNEKLAAFTAEWAKRKAVSP